MKRLVCLLVLVLVLAFATEEVFELWGSEPEFPTYIGKFMQVLADLDDNTAADEGIPPQPTLPGQQQQQQQQQVDPRYACLPIVTNFILTKARMFNTPQQAAKRAADFCQQGGNVQCLAATYPTLASKRVPNPVTQSLTYCLKLK